MSIVFRPLFAAFFLLFLSTGFLSSADVSAQTYYTRITVTDGSNPISGAKIVAIDDVTGVRVDSALTGATGLASLSLGITNVSSEQSADLPSESGLSIFPNPAAPGAGQVAVVSPTAQKVSLTTYDLLGRELARLDTRVDAGTTTLRLPGTEGLAQGTYLARLRIGFSVVNRTFVISSGGESSISGMASKPAPQRSMRSSSTAEYRFEVSKDGYATVVEGPRDISQRAQALFTVSLYVPGSDTAIEGVLANELSEATPEVEINLSGPGGTQSVTTDENGSFRFGGLTPGDYTVNIVNPRPDFYLFPEETTSVTVRPSEIRTLELTTWFTTDAIFNPPTGYITVCGYNEPVGTTYYDCVVKDFSDYGYGEIEDYVPNGTLPFLGPDPLQRRAELDAISEQARDELCLAGWGPPDFASHEVAPIGLMDDGNRGISSPLFDSLLNARNQYLYLDNVDAGLFIVRTLRAWAEAGSILGSPFVDNGGAWLDAKQVFNVMLRAWEVMRASDLASDDDVALIDQYMHDLRTDIGFTRAARVGDNAPNGLDVFNHGWDMDFGLMGYGVLYNDAADFQLGIRRFFAVMDGLIRPDGSHFFESQRGDTALSYSLNATDLLVRIAEVAKNQGYDLYSIEVDGLTLDDVIDFHVAAVNDLELIAQYANTTAQDFRYTPRFNLFGWAVFEFVLQRRNDEVTDLFRQVFPWWDDISVAIGPMYQSCELRPVD